MENLPECPCLAPAPRHQFNEEVLSKIPQNDYKRGFIGFTWNMPLIKNSCSILGLFSFMKVVCIFKPEHFIKMCKNLKKAEFDPQLPEIPSYSVDKQAMSRIQFYKSCQRFFNLCYKNKSLPRQVDNDVLAFNHLIEFMAGKNKLDYSGSESSNCFDYLGLMSSMVLKYDCFCSTDDPLKSYHHETSFKVPNEHFLKKLSFGEAMIPKCHVCGISNLLIQSVGCRNSTIFLRFLFPLAMGYKDLTKMIPKALTVTDLDSKQPVLFRLGYFNLTCQKKTEDEVFGLAHTVNLMSNDFFPSDLEQNYSLYDSLYNQGRFISIPNESHSLLLLNRWMSHFSDQAFNSCYFSSVVYIRHTEK